jgi:predicted CXXCH cytochrome family protein
MGRNVGKLAIALVALAALLAAGLLIPLRATKSAPVKLEVIQGEVEVELGYLPASQKVVGPASLLTGDQIKVLPGATALLTYADGSTILLSDEAEAKVAYSSQTLVRPLLCSIVPSSLCPPQYSSSYITTVVAGKARAHAQDLANPSRLFQVQTTHSLAEAKGSVFEVEVGPDGRAQWRSLEGQVAVGYLLELEDGRLAATATLLSEGQTLEVRALPPPKPERVEEAASLMAAARQVVHQAATEEGTVDLAREGRGLSLNTAGVQPANEPKAPLAAAQAAPSGVLCLECHQELKAKAQGKSRHQPFVKGECTACHKSFHEGTKEQRSPEQEIALCLSCHPQGNLGLSHPVGPKLVDANTKGPLTCSSSCHDPHGSQYRALSRVGEGDRLCMSCHKVGTQNRSSAEWNLAQRSWGCGVLGQFRLVPYPGEAG